MRTSEASNESEARMLVQGSLRQTECSSASASHLGSDPGSGDIKDPKTSGILSLRNSLPLGIGHEDFS